VSLDALGDLANDKIKKIRELLWNFETKCKIQKIGQLNKITE